MRKVRRDERNRGLRGRSDRLIKISTAGGWLSRFRSGWPRPAALIAEGPSFCQNLDLRGCSLARTPLSRIDGVEVGPNVQTAQLTGRRMARASTLAGGDCAILWSVAAVRSGLFQPCPGQLCRCHASRGWRVRRGVLSDLGVVDERRDRVEAKLGVRGAVVIPVGDALHVVRCRVGGGGTAVPPSGMDFVLGGVADGVEVDVGAGGVVGVQVTLEELVQVPVLSFQPAAVQEPVTGRVQPEAQFVTPEVSRYCQFWGGLLVSARMNRPAGIDPAASVPTAAIPLIGMPPVPEEPMLVPPESADVVVPRIVLVSSES